MTEFVASNGAKFEEQPNGTIVFTGGILDPRMKLSPGMAYGLREFFQHERDEELGRWRWPENPNFVVHAEDGGAHNVVNENTGLSLMATRGGVNNHDDEHAYAARAYFEAHPERKPNPWDEATYKDVWVWTTADGTQEALGWVAGDGSWDIITPRGDGIKAADDPLTALVEGGFEKFSGEVKGTKRTPEGAS